MDNENQMSQTPDANPNTNKGESKPVRNDDQPQPEERLWKHESEIPDRSSGSKGNVGSGQRSDTN